MKRRFTILLAALLLSCGLSWAQTRTEVTDVLDRALTGVTNGSSTYTEWSGKTSNSDAVYAGQSAGGNNAIQLRSKNNNSGIITTASGGVVTKVTIEWNDNTAEGRTLNVYGKNSAYSAATDLYDNQNQGTLIGTIVCGTSTELIFEDEYEYIGMRSAEGAMYLDEVDIIWENGTAANDPTITADNVSIEYDATSGSIAYVINNGVEDGVLSAEVSSNSTIEEFELDPVGASPITFSCLANETTSERTATVTLTYTYGDDQTVSKNVIVTQAAAPAPALPNIAALTALTDAGDYAVTLTDAVVTYNNGNYAYIQDASGAVVYYKNGHGLTAGDVLNGTATVTYQVRNSNPQITNLTDVTPVSGTAPEPTEVASSAWDYTFGNVLSQYFKVTGATITQNGNKYYVSLGGEDIQLYKAGGAISGLNLDKTYSITGFPTMYNTTKELQIFDNPVEEASTEPSITIAPAMVEVNAAGEDGSQMVTLSITLENIQVETSFAFGIQFYDAEGVEQDDPTWMVSGVNGTNDDGYFVNLTILDNYDEARSAYLKVHASDNNGEEVYSNSVTVNQAAYEAPNVTWDLSIASYDEITDPDIVTWSSEYATMTNSSKTGGTSASNYLGGDSNDRTSSRFYSGNTLTISPEVGYAIVSVVFTATSGNYANALASSTWTNATASAEGTTVTVTPTSGASAIQAVIGGTCGFTQVKVYYEQHEAQYYDLTISLNENIPFIFVFDANDQNDPLIEDGAAGTVQVLEGTSIMVSPDVAEGYVLETLLVNDENVVSQLDESGAYTFTMPAENVTISATAVEYVAPAPFAPTVYTKATSITSGAHYIIVGFNGSDAYAMGAQNNNNRGSVIVSENGTIATVVNENVYDFVVEAVEGTNFYSIYDERNSGYLYAASSSSNHLKTQAENNNNGYWDIDFENLDITAQGQNTRNKMRFNYNNGNPIFSCYGSGQQPVYLYVKSDETPANNEITIEGTDFGTAEAPTNAGYKLIASPFNNVNPQDVAGMLAGNYDLYYFDENGMDDGELKEWRNYKTSSFLFKSGKGYLYASENGATLNFIGAPYAGEGEVGLDYTEGNRFAGFNLIGNPFNTNATLVDMPYYRLNSDGSALNTSTETSQINVMEGVFVQATPENTTAHFTTAAGSKIISQLNVKVTRNRGAVLDNAIIRFDNGAMLGKFQLNPNSTKVYITEGNEDYAIVRSAAESEMPVSFKAAENGTYTLSVVAENVEMNYLHLIDNMTGTDVDLLATPSYSFEANTTDYANRFRLVFNANGLEENSNFAFFNGSEWVVSNMGDATLQVIDMTGRVISSETVNGNVTFSTNGLTAGVYMMRLVNGNDVKTQKVLVK